jgi:hypothetical protein
MSVIFPVISRYSGYMKTVEVTRPLGKTTRDKVIADAAAQGWALEHGYQNSLLAENNPTGELQFVTDKGAKIHLEFGVKGQITYCSINYVRVDRERFAAVVAALADGTVAPDGTHELPKRIDPAMTKREAYDLVRKVRTAGCVDHTTPDGKTWRLTPSPIGSSAIWAKEI